MRMSESVSPFPSRSADMIPCSFSFVKPSIAALAWIISTMLSMFGITSERAENGRICVDKMREAKEGSYELIFMDVQMPEMNGLDATREIRKLENSWASSIPIVAMTADAFSENVTECLNAGMNGHIAKPIDIKLVIKEIRRIREERKKL